MELKKISNLAGIMDRILKIVQIINYILMGITLLSSIATMASAGHLNLRTRLTLETIS